MIAVLSNVNCDPVVRRVSKKTECVENEGYGNVIEALMNPFSAVNRQEPAQIFLLMDLRELIGEREDFADRIDEFFSNLSSCLKSGVQYIISDGDYYLGTDMSFRGDSVPRRACHYWNEALYKLCGDNKNCFVFPLAGLVRSAGEAEFYNDVSWNMGSIRYSMNGVKAVSETILSICGIIEKGVKKVLVLDLDNTLWGGIAGEDGLDVKIADSGIGKAYKEFQTAVMSLKNSGTIIAVVSKNNEKDAWEIIDSHPHMVIKRDDISAYRINWNSKAQNIAEIAKELNVGTDSMVFVDDNPLERQEIAELLPEVTVPGFPEDPSMLPRFASELTCRYFRRMSITDEDRNKTAQYIAKREIERSKSGFADFSDFLRSLEITVSAVSPAENLARAAQLAQKTNQFNTTVTRYSGEELSRMTGGDGWRVYLFDVSDKFAKHGICAMVTVKLCEIPVIDDFIMSCRVMGRNIEFGILDAVEKDLAASGFTEIEALFRKGPKNMPVEKLYDDGGYELISDDGNEKTYRKPLYEAADNGKFIGIMRI